MTCDISVVFNCLNWAFFSLFFFFFFFEGVGVGRGGEVGVLYVSCEHLGH